MIPHPLLRGSLTRYYHRSNLNNTLSHQSLFERNSTRALLLCRYITSLHTPLHILPSTSTVNNDGFSINCSFHRGLRHFNSKSSDNKMPLMNNLIRFPQVRVVYDNPDDGGKQAWKILTRYEALDFAKEMGKDLILVNGTTQPPICKLDDRSRFVKELIDKRKSAKSKPKIMKEILIAAGIDPHDLGIKINKITDFLDGEHQVKVSAMIKKGDKRNGVIELQKLCLKLMEELEPIAVSVHQLKSPVPSKKEFIFNPKRKQKPSESPATENIVNE